MSYVNKQTKLHYFNVAGILISFSVINRTYQSPRVVISLMVKTLNTHINISNSRNFLSGLSNVLAGVCIWLHLAERSKKIAQGITLFSAFSSWLLQIRWLFRILLAEIKFETFTPKWESNTFLEGIADSVDEALCHLLHVFNLFLATHVPSCKCTLWSSVFCVRSSVNASCWACRHELSTIIFNYQLICSLFLWLIN